MITVLFEAWPYEKQRKLYFELATELKTELTKIEGFISVERFQSLSDEDKIMSVSLWGNEEAVMKWRKVENHKAAQQSGKDRIFRDYKITVSKAMRVYSKENTTNEKH